jgi:hypothetical protein
MKKVLIFNVEGKKLYAFSTLNNLYALNDQNLEPGFYIAKINNGIQNINKGFWVK